MRGTAGMVHGSAGIDVMAAESGNESETGTGTSGPCTERTGIGTGTGRGRETEGTTGTDQCASTFVETVTTENAIEYAVAHL